MINDKANNQDPEKLVDNGLSAEANLEAAQQPLGKPTKFSNRAMTDDLTGRALKPPRDILPRAAIYARVSTEDQTTENQIPVLKELAVRRGWEVADVYAEEASAWRAGHQLELKRLLKRASYHEYDILIVWALDRLTREGIGNIMQLFNTFRTYGVKVISHQEPWLEQAGPMADLLTAIAGWAAQFESARRSERIKAAFTRKRARGEPVGRQRGAKDKKPRKRMGYILRYNDRRK